MLKSEVFLIKFLQFKISSYFVENFTTFLYIYFLYRITIKISKNYFNFFHRISKKTILSSLHITYGVTLFLITVYYTPNTHIPYLNLNCLSKIRLNFLITSVL